MFSQSLFKSANRLMFQSVWSFLSINIILLCTMLVSLEFASSVRSYIEAESLWSKGQKRASMALISYIDTQSNSDYERFVKAISIPMGDHAARIAMESATSDSGSAFNGFVKGGNNPGNVPGMIRLYRYFGHTWLMREPVRIWAEADDKISQLDAIGSSVRRHIQEGRLSRLDKSNFLDEIQANDLAVTHLEKAFSESLILRSGQLDRLTSILLVVITILLTSIGLIFSRRFAIRLVTSSKAERHESEKNQAILSNSSDGIHILDRDGNLVEFSDYFCNMLGYSRNEMLGMNVSQWDAHFTDPQELMSDVRRRFQIPEVTRLETKHRRKDGTIIDVEISGFPFELDGKPVLFNSSREITERKKFELDLINQKEMFQAQQEFLNTILESEPECVKVVAPNGSLIQMNPAGLAMFEVSSVEEAQEVGLLNFVFPEYRNAFIHLMSRILVGETGFLEFQITGKKGTQRWLATHAVPLRDALGNITSLLGVTRDITKQKQTELSLLRQIELTESVINAIPDLMFELDLNGKYINLWAHDPKLLASQKEALLGKTVDEVLPDGAAQTVMSALKEASSQGTSKGQIICLDLPHGRSWFELSTSKMSTDQVQDQHFIMLSREITDRKLAEEKIQQLAYYDHLTGLPNRRLFRDRLEQDMKRVMRNKTSLALLFIDLDKFKEVNDTLGHDKGDILLIEASKRIRQHVRDADTVARLGGDEFAIVLPEYGETGHIDRVVQDVLQALEIPFNLGNRNVGHISGSIGIALYPEEAGSIDDLLRHADQAMYAAKHSRASRFNYFTRSMQEEARNKLDLTNDLRRALERNQLEVYFQPIVDAQSGEIVKAEALLRWHHPVQGMISPIMFIPLAEESGLILTIGEWVFEEALRNIARWKKSTGKLIQVSVNKSSAQFMHSETHPWHESYLNSGLPEHIVTVEITESLLLSDSDRIRNQFNFFKEHGIELSIDDFGTGFSALSYLHQFDVDYLKIDKSFVQKMVTDSSSRALTEAIIIMAHKLDIKTIAEGVETEAQRDLLKSFGCDYIQGYLYSKPVPSHEFEKLIVG